MGNVVCIFDKDYDERLKSHIEPSRTVLMNEPFRSHSVNPYLYSASPFNRNESVRKDKDTEHLRELLDLRVSNVAQGLNVIQESYYYKKDNPDGTWGNVKSNPVVNMMLPEGFKDKDGEIPALFKNENGTIKPTKAFFMLLDRINECAEKEKEIARDIGRKEGMVAGYEIARKCVNEHANLDEEMKNPEYPDYSPKIDGIIINNSTMTSDLNQKMAEKALNEIWEIQDKHDINPNEKIYFG